MNACGIDMDASDPYLGLDFTWMDSALSEWLELPADYRIDETVGNVSTGIGMNCPVDDEAAASQRS